MITIKTPSILSATGSAVALGMLIQPIIKELVPMFYLKAKKFAFATLHKLFTKFFSRITIVIHQRNELSSNQLYTAVESYLLSKNASSARRFNISKDQHHQSFNILTENEEETVDVYDGIQLKWRFKSKSGRAINTPGHAPMQMHSNSHHHGDGEFELSFHKKHKDKVINSYLSYVVSLSEDIKQDDTKVVKLFSTSSGSYSGKGPWSSVNLNHPATFEKLAMEDTTKKMIIEDLDRFVKRREFYKRVGKAWKRGYLLYGPPGTGKSSLIAAMANYLSFDIYDLELSDIGSNSSLRRILLSTANRSILVIEDIDCSLEFRNSRRYMSDMMVPPTSSGGSKMLDPQLSSGGSKMLDPQQLTLSGMFNFMDGLWSSCGDERIIVFTTNHKDRLDPALLRPGRMDVHIHMSYCTPCGFKLLARNYLEISDHPAFKEIEELLQISNVTPAEVAETLLKDDDPDIILHSLVEILQEKKLLNANAG